MILCLYWAKHKFEGIWLIGVKGQYIETSWNHLSFTGLTYSHIAATTWSLLLEVKISSSTKSSVWVANFCVRSYNWSVLPSSGRWGWRGSCQAGDILGVRWGGFDFSISWLYRLCFNDQKYKLIQVEKAGSFEPWNWEMPTVSSPPLHFPFTSFEPMSRTSEI